MLQICPTWTGVHGCDQHETGWISECGSGKDDFGISSDNLLIVSEKIFSVLRKHNIDMCDIETW